MQLARTVRRRLIVLLAIMGVWTGLIVLRLVNVQVSNSERLKAQAARQQSSVVEVTAARGAILDRSGRALALSRKLKSFYAVPADVDQPDKASRAIARILKTDRRKLKARLTDSKHDFVWVARKVTDEQASHIEDLGFGGIASLEEPGRVYPRGQLMAQVLGYVGVDNDGLAGIEHRYDELIRGTAGKRLTLRDARGVRLLPAGGKPARPGHDAVLTLDAVAQHYVERELRAGVEASGAQSGLALALDPSSGEVLAMASYPTFDPNRYGRFAQSRWRNNVVTAAFEPGSTFKLVTFAAALEKDLVTRSEWIDCGRGGIKIAGHFMRDHASFDWLTPQQVFANSSNVGTIVIGRRLAAQAHYAGIRKLGFGETTGIDLPGEARGILRAPKAWSGLSQASISIGQELSVTALQLTVAYAAVANGGVAMQPYVLKQLVSSEGEVVEERTPKSRGRVVSQRVTDELVGYLEEVVASGTGKLAQLEGYSAAGKTGTAQKVGPNGGGYLVGKYTASFVGFAPSRRPRVVLLVVIDEPRGKATHGGDVAAPVFRAIMQPLLAYLGVPPESLQQAAGVPLQDYFPDVRAESTPQPSAGQAEAVTAQRAEPAADPVLR